MKLLFMALFLSVAFLAAAQDQTPSPPLPPGNPDHVEPDFNCVTETPLTPAPDGARACACHEHRQCSIDQGTGERVVVESATCLSYCFKSHCHCALHCPDTH